MSNIRDAAAAALETQTILDSIPLLKDLAEIGFPCTLTCLPGTPFDFVYEISTPGRHPVTTTITDELLSVASYEVSILMLTAIDRTVHTAAQQWGLRPALDLVEKLKAENADLRKRNETLVERTAELTSSLGHAESRIDAILRLAEGTATVAEVREESGLPVVPGSEDDIYGFPL